MGDLLGQINLLLIVLVYVLGVAFAYGLGGWRFALAVATLGILHGAYSKGKKDATKAASKRSKEIQEKREAAYEEIDNRNTGKSDVVDRLRKSGF